MSITRIVKNIINNALLHLEERPKVCLIANTIPDFLQGLDIEFLLINDILKGGSIDEDADISGIVCVSPLENLQTLEQAVEQWQLPAVFIHTHSQIRPEEAIKLSSKIKKINRIKNLCLSAEIKRDLMLYNAAIIDEKDSGLLQSSLLTLLKN